VNGNIQYFDIPHTRMTSLSAGLGTGHGFHSFVRNKFV
jgi:hypothetical protein